VKKGQDERESLRRLKLIAGCNASKRRRRCVCTAGTPEYKYIGLKSK
jgi:hypothetical protein